MVPYGRTAQSPAVPSSLRRSYIDKSGSRLCSETVGSSCRRSCAAGCRWHGFCGVSGHGEPVKQFVASGFAREECFKVVFGDQPAASCLYRPELAGAQQVMDELPGDAQWFSGFVRTAGEPLNQALRAEISRTRASRSSRMSVASSRAIAFVLSSAGAAASGAAMSLPASLAGAASLRMWRRPAPWQSGWRRSSKGLPVTGRPGDILPGSLGDSPALPSRTGHLRPRMSEQSAHADNGGPGG